MKKSFIAILSILILSCKVQSDNLIEEMLLEIKQINQKVDDNHKIIETMKEEMKEMKEVKKNITYLDSKINSVELKTLDKSNNIAERVSKIEMLVEIFERTIVVSSEGLAAEKRGEYLGQYQYDKLRKVFVQKNSRKGARLHYLYQTENMQWGIGNELGEESGWIIKNEKKTQGPEDVPMSGWLVNVGWWKTDITWKTDDTLKITNGLLIPTCLKIKIEGSKWAQEAQPEKLGEFKLSKKWFNGHPMYENEKGEFLFMSYGGEWAVDSSTGSSYDGIRGSPGYLCQTKSTKWEFDDFTEDDRDVLETVDWGITVSCSEHQ